MRSRSLAAVLLAAALTATACGGATPAADEGSASSGSASGSGPASASGSGSGSSTEVEAAGEARVVTHDMGETEVPAEPQRVVVLDSPHLDTALSLGVEPVGAVAVFDGQGLPAYLGDRTEGIEVVGTIEEPDLEAIATLEPDLILSATVRHEGIYDQLSQIAPTVFTESSGTDWKQGFELVAEALGQTEEGQQALAEYDDRVAQLGEDLGASEMTASIVRFLPDQTRIYGPDTFSGSVLAEVGFQLPDLEYDEYSMAYISPEQFEQASADVIFTTTYGDPAETTQSDVTALWGNLPAVQNGCQFDVADDEWMIGIGLIGAGIILDDVEAFLTEHDCAT
jgi:iron complex transport system substrate-binding protein